MNVTRQLLDEVIAEQRVTTAVTEFARGHERGEFHGDRYRRLLPVSAPQAGEQYAFEVDLDKCTGCKACVTACHSLNGLDENEAWRETGLLISNDWREPYQQAVTTACHHCIDPACLNGCPVLAYEKDSTTGIVRHLDDQCIGCQYCVMMCPYEVPKYSPSRGIVRKCDMCSSRLAAAEAPACAQACPNEAIRITLVKPDTLDFGLPASPDPKLTLPTTRYLTKRALPKSIRAADHEALREQPAHLPLVVMLVLSQLAVGLWAFALVHTSNGQALAALLVFAAAMGASVLHLGRPIEAWRSFLGLRRSWLSREIAAFGLCLALAIAWTLVPARQELGVATVTAGVIAIFCSAMVYHATRRAFWHLKYSLPKFLLTAVRLGTGGTILAGIAVGQTAHPAMLVLLAASTLAKFGIDAWVLRNGATDDFTPLHKTALLLTGQFGLARRLRVTCSLLGGIVLPGWIALTVPSLLMGIIAFSLSLASELIERWLFFTCVQTVAMPGVNHAS